MGDTGKIISKNCDQIAAKNSGLKKTLKKYEALSIEEKKCR